MKIIEKSVEELTPYENNPRKNDGAVDAVAASIREFGFKVPIIIDKAGVIVAGHTRLKAAKKLSLQKVPCIIADDLTDEQIQAFRLADNKTAELAEWDFDLLTAELRDLGEIDMSEFGFDMSAIGGGQHEWFDDHETGKLTDEDSEEYAEFLEKFKAKKTTDDCYTPRQIYDAVAKWVSDEYGIDSSRFVRPFYPGGDYQSEKYPAGCVVVDNPPFSILSEILRFYDEKGISFFLFGPTLTLFSSAFAAHCTSIPIAGAATYENGATVNTSFLTNLEDKSIRVRTAPSLYTAVKEANEAVQKELHKELPNYSYPDHIITSAMVGKWSRYGIDFRLSVDDSEPISALDAQKEVGKKIFGKGYLLSERAAAERAAAERAAAERAAAERAAAERAAAERAAAHKWELSEREWQIVRSLGNGEAR